MRKRYNNTTGAGDDMNIKERIKKAENALQAGDGIRLEWIEPDEKGEFLPVRPGEIRINLKWEPENYNHKTAVADGKGSISND